LALSLFSSKKKKVGWGWKRWLNGIVLLLCVTSVISLLMLATSIWVAWVKEVLLKGRSFWRILIPHISNHWWQIYRLGMGATVYHFWLNRDGIINMVITKKQRNKFWGKYKGMSVPRSWAKEKSKGMKQIWSCAVTGP